MYIHLSTCSHVHVHTWICGNVYMHEYMYIHIYTSILSDFFSFDCVVKLTGTCFQTANAALQSRSVCFLVVQSCNITVSIFP